MQNAGGVRRPERGQNLEPGLGRPLRRERAVVLHDITEPAVRKLVRASLQHHPSPPVVFDHVEDHGNVGMVEPGQRAGVPEHTLVR